MSMTASNLTVRRGEREVLTGVTVSVDDGRVLALVGPNGAGKSTLLAALSGDLPLERGEILVDGVELTSIKPLDLAQRRAVLLQDNSVTFGFTAREIVAMGRNPWMHSSVSVADDEQLITSSLEMTDAAHLAERPFRSLSGGERARVSLARVLAQQTQNVLLDEPTAALDLRHQEAVMSLARRLAHDDGRAVAVVVHDLSLAAAYADDVAVIEGGRLTHFGLPGDVLTKAVVGDVYRIPVHRIRTPDNHYVLIPQRPTENTKERIS